MDGIVHATVTRGQSVFVVGRTFVSATGLRVRAFLPPSGPLDANLKPGPELYAVEQATRSVELGEKSGLRGWFYLVDGMARYRQGKFAPAIEVLRNAQNELKLAVPGRLLTEFFIAMAQYRSGDVNGARATYDAAAAFMPRRLDTEPNANWEWVGSTGSMPASPSARRNR